MKSIDNIAEKVSGFRDIVLIVEQSKKEKIEAEVMGKFSELTEKGVDTVRVIPLQKVKKSDASLDFVEMVVSRFESPGTLVMLDAGAFEVEELAHKIKEVEIVKLYEWED